MEYMGYQPDVSSKDISSLSDAVKYAVTYVQQNDKNIFSFALEDRYLKELEAFIYRYIDYHTELPLKSSKILKNMY